MKPFATAIAVAALLFVSGAEATETFDWTGAASTGWLDPNNWTQSPGSNSYPGDLGRTTDVVNIKADPNGNQPIYTAVAGTRIVATIDIDANAPSTDVSLTVASGSLTTGGLVTVKGRLTTVQRDATLSVTGGTFAPDSLRFEGSTNSSYGYAYGDFDVSVTVQDSCDGTVDTYMEGYVDIDFTNSVTVDAKDLGIGDSSSDEANVSLSGAGTLNACSVVIDGGSGANSIVAASNGAMLQTR